MEPPRIEAVEVIGSTRLRITWTAGERLKVDLAEPINRLKVLAPLRDPAAFGRHLVIQLPNLMHHPCPRQEANHHDHKFSLVRAL